MPKKLNLIGQQFGKLLVIKYVGIERTHKAYLCRCECGNEKVITSSDLRSGRVNSCGCYRKENLTLNNITHGLRNHRLYNIWADMKSRCYNPKATHYKEYGGRGIVICEEWKDDFKTFYDWAMSNGYEDDLTIDRINNDGDYVPSNCRWVTSKEQSRNTRRNKLFTLNNETKTLINWCEEYQINYKTVRDRLKRGWGIEKALKAPVQTKFRRKEGGV